MGFDPDEVSDILDACLALPHSARQAELGRLCGGRDAIRREVESLLEYLPDPEFEGEDLTDGESVRAERRIGLEIGGCRLLELLAIGGMGAVYRAEQESPRREVALKLLRTESSGVDGWRRLKREAIALGRLDHPAIARVFTAGIHRGMDGPTPFLTMELVTGGRSITEWWRSTPLPPEQRLERFATICEAVHHGHIKGVLHRDIKPTNLLIDGEDRPKVIDFGIARMIGAGLHDGTAPVTGGSIIGTVAYMAPERFESSADIDVRSDVYSLGVVLHELLTGRLPFGDANGSLAATAAAIASQEPPRPSAFNRKCRGNLDAIVRTAMSRDPAHRYDSASALAADLRSHLSYEPIRARNHGRISRIRLFVRRHRIAAAAVLAVIASLSIGLAFSLRATARAEQSLYLARLAQAQASLSMNDIGSALRTLESLGPGRQDDWPVRMIRRGTDDTIDSARFREWNLLRGRMDSDRGRLLANSKDPRPELVVLRTSPASVEGVIQLPCDVLAADWAVHGTEGADTVIAALEDGRVVEVRVDDGAIVSHIARIEPTGPDGIPRAISDIALEPGGRRLAVGRSPDLLRLMDLIDGSSRDLPIFAGPAAAQRIFVEWSPQGHSLAVASSAGTFIVDAGSDSIRRLSPHSANQAVFSPDGSRIAVALTGGGSEIIEVASGTSRLMCPGVWPAWGVDWSPDGSLVAMTGQSHWITVYNSTSGSRYSFRSSAESGWTARWISDERFMVLPEGAVFSVRARPPRVAPIQSAIADPDLWELRLRFIDDGRTLVSTGPQGRIDRVDPLLKTRQEITRVPVTTPSTDATPDGTAIVVADATQPGPIWLHRTLEGGTRKIEGDFLGPVAISPDGRRVAAFGRQGEPLVVDVASGRVEPCRTNRSLARKIAFAWIDPDTVAFGLPQGAAVLARDKDGIWSVQLDRSATLLEAWRRGDDTWYWTDSSQRVARSETRRMGDPAAPDALRDIGIVLCMAAHPTLPLVAFGMSDGRIVVFDESRDSVVFGFQPMSRRLTDLAWSPDGSMLAAIAVDGAIHVFDSQPLSNRWPEIKRREETGIPGLTPRDSAGSILREPRSVSGQRQM